MKKLSCLFAILLGLGVVATAIFLPIGRSPALPQREGRPVPALSQDASRKPIPSTASHPLDDGATVASRHDVISLSSLPVTLRDSQGNVRTVDIKSPDASGFIETKKGERYRVSLKWPHPDTTVWATRMDGGTFDGDKGMLLKIPMTGRGEIDFGFLIGSEPGRYQIELAGASGATEHIAFWADPPNLPIEPSGTSFVEPPLRQISQQ